MNAKRFKNGQLPTVWRLAWPSMLEELMDTAVQYIDMAMVGSLGTLATAAVGATVTVNWLIGGTVRAVGVGLLACISRALGAGDPERAKRFSAQSVFLTLITGLFFTVLTLSVSGVLPVWMQADEAVRETASRYFAILYAPMLFRAAVIVFGTVIRAGGDTRTPMRVGIAMNVTNVVMNFFLIYPARQLQIGPVSFFCPGAGWGVEGAAAASAASFVLGGILMFICLHRHKVVSPKGYPLRLDKKLLRPCLRVAFPNMLQRFCTSSGYVVFAGLINGLGSVATAAHTVANTVESLFYIPAYGMQTAAAALTGMALGANDREKLVAQEKTFLLLQICLMTGTGTLLFLTAPFMAGLFSRDAAVLTLGALVLRMVAVSEPFYGISVVTEGMLQGAGLTAKPFLFNTVSMWAVRNLGTFLCLRFFGGGLASAWACMIAGNMLLMVHFRLYFRKEKDRLFAFGRGEIK